MGLGISHGVKCATGGDIKITYLGNYLTGIPIGPARPDRLIVIFGFAENDAGGSFSACTFNGASGTMHYGPTISDCFGVASKVVPSGTTVDIVPTIFGGARWAVYMVTGFVTGVHSGSAFSGSGSPLGVTGLSLPTGKCAVLMGSRSRDFMSSPGAYSGGGLPSVVMDQATNFAGGGNPSLICSSGLSDASGAAANSYHQSSGYSDGIGYALVVK